MTAEEHFEEEFLIFLAEGPAQKDTHPHLIDCAECASAVDEYRTVLTSFAQESTWDTRPLDETPNAGTIANLRAFADQMKREDAEAEPLVAELLAGPREEWMPRLMADGKYRTAGVVRRLLAEADQKLAPMPPDALQATALACDIADGFNSPDHGVEQWISLRGIAHLDRAYAFFTVGNIAAAREEATRAESIFASAEIYGFNLARVQLVTAQIMRASDQVSEGLVLARKAKTTFETYGDIRRVAVAASTSAYLLTKASNFRDARFIWSDVLAAQSNVIDDAFRGDLLLNIAYCERELGDLQSSLALFRSAQFIFETLEIPTRVARARYNVAALLVSAGSFDAAAAEFQRVIAEFKRLGMFGVAAVASLDLAEVRLEQHRHSEVEALCNEALEYLREAGLEQSSRAFRALALLREVPTSAPPSTSAIAEIRSTLRKESAHLLRLELMP